MGVVNSYICSLRFKILKVDGLSYNQNIYLFQLELIIFLISLMFLTLAIHFRESRFAEAD